MGRRANKEMDRLTRDVLEAERLGYGVHYGHYKADHPHTGDPGPRKIDPGSVECICTQCGKKYTKPRNSARHFCSNECRFNHARAEVAKKRAEETKEEVEHVQK